MTLLYYIIVTLICKLAAIGADIQETVSPDCKEVRENFANASSDFIKCSIEYSRPITFCEECVMKYLGVLRSYKNMSKVLNNGTTPCINDFVNLDRLGIVQILYDNSISLWTRAKCYACFLIDNNTQTVSISNQTKKFLQLYGVYSACVNQTNNSICSECLDKYNFLQNYFLSISNENEKIGACMDIVDLMNTTWTFWGEKCCKFRRHNEYVFITSTVAVLIITLLFYIVAQVYAKKKLPTIIEQTRFLNTLET